MSDRAVFPIGFIQKSHGLKGELLVSLDATNIEFEKRIRIVWLGDNPDHLHPWNVEYLRLNEGGAFLKLKLVNSREEADYLKGLTVYIPLADIGADEPVHLIGFTVFSIEDDREIGTVSDVDINPFQQRLIINSERGEIYIPYVNEFINRIDTKNNQVWVTLIDGMDV